MEVINHTPFEVEALPTKGPEDKTVLTIIVKGTFEMRPNEPAIVASEQIPVAYGDEPYDEEDGGSVKFEADIAPFKPRADIVLVGRAYAPGEKAVTSLNVSLRVGDVSKTIRVIGDRRWEVGSRFFPVYASDPELFTVMDLVYERAFGGIDTKGGDWCKENLIGRGFFAKRSKEVLNDAPLPNLEDPDNLIQSWKDHPKPVGFGFYGRAWMPRSGYLGTYDEKWRKERSPDPPEDFRFDYYNAAHPDLQVEGYLKGDEKVELINLTPDGRVRFQLPGIRLSVTVTKSDAYEADASSTSAEVEEGMEEEVEDEEIWEEMEDEVEYEIDDEMWDEMEDEPEYETWEDAEATELSSIMEEVNLNLDTLCLIPDEGRFYLVWRGLCPINDLTALEVSEVEVTEV